jgi:uncharacterized protein (TIGR02246 family)
MNFPGKSTAVLVVILSILTSRAQSYPQDNLRKGNPMTEQSAVDKRSQDAIHTLLSEVQAAWNMGNVKQFAQAFSEDAVFIPFNGQRLNGRAAILNLHVHPFATELRGSKLDFDIVDIRALATGIFLVSTDGGPLLAGEAYRIPETQTFVIQDFGDHWAIVSFQNTPVLPPRDH